MPLACDPEEYKNNPIHLSDVRRETLEYFENMRSKYGGNIENMLTHMRTQIQNGKYQR
jgi:hypothetical protein